MAELHARYERLSPDEQRILRVLSVVCESVGQTVLQQILDALAWHDQAGAPLRRLLNKTTPPVVSIFISKILEYPPTIFNP